MTFIPDWAPNIHPMVIHFPIVLFIFALLLDLLNIFFKNKDWLKSGALFLYVFGIIATFTAFFTGRQAADTVSLPDAVIPLVSDHADWALRTLWFFGVFVLLRFALRFKKLDRKKWILTTMVVLAFVGNYLVYQTAEHGAQLVYRFGVGVKKPPKAAEPEIHLHENKPLSQGITQLGTDSWKWEANENALSVLKNQVQWKSGNPQAVNPAIEQDQKLGTVVALNLKDTDAAFTFGKILTNVSVTAVFNSDDFQGEFFIVHHYRDIQNYDFFSFGKNEMKLGRLINGSSKIMDSKTLQLNGWNTLQVVGTKGHFRGIVNDKLILHGHGKDLPKGDVGLLFKGTGTIFMKEVEFKTLQ